MRTAPQVRSSPARPPDRRTAPPARFLPSSSLGAPSAGHAANAREEVARARRASYKRPVQRTQLRRAGALARASARASARPPARPPARLHGALAAAEEPRPPDPLLSTVCGRLNALDQRLAQTIQEQRGIAEPGPGPEARARTRPGPGLAPGRRLQTTPGRGPIAQAAKSAISHGRARLFRRASATASV